MKVMPILGIAATAALLTGCAASTRPAGPTETEAAQNRARPYLEGAAALERYRASLECETVDAAQVAARLSELEEQVTNFHTVRMYRYERESRDSHTNLAFDFADAALERGCLEKADTVYRRLVEFYVGASYSGIRDRARIGIDDVRARQASATPPVQSKVPLSPMDLVGGLQGIGMSDGSGRGWHRSNFDGIWNASLRKRYGSNEVSCLIESTQGDRIESVELEAEFYHPTERKEAVLVQFEKAVAVVYPEAPLSLMDAISEDRSWTGDSWRFARQPYANGGYGLRLTMTSR